MSLYMCASVHACFCIVQGEEMLLQVKGMHFHWLDIAARAPITTQLINRIRVWGIGLENER